MRKFCFVLCWVLPFLLFGSAGFAQEDVAVKVDGREVAFEDQEPFIDENHRIQVPIRFVAEEMGARIIWDGREKTVTVEDEERTVRFLIGEREFTVNDEAKEMDTAPFISEGRATVPLRFVAEALGLGIEWYSETRTAVLLSEDKKDKEEYRKADPEVVQAIPDYHERELYDIGIRAEIASYTTHYDPATEGRASNIRLAAESIDNTILPPGEEFSMNEAAGPYNRERGFQPAPVFRQGEVLTGIGGGVCQNSSTLYNAALLAGLDVTERHSHSLPVWYLPLGRDASVSYGTTDLKFVNNLSNHVYIQMEAAEGVLTTSIYGIEEREVELRSTIVETISPPEEYVESPDVYETVVVQGGEEGYRTVTHIVIDGQEKVHSRDYYRPVERIIKVPQ